MENEVEAGRLREAGKRIIVALDVNDVWTAMRIITLLQGKVGGFKIGLEFLSTILTTLLFHPDEAVAEAWFRDSRRFCSALDGNIFWDGKFNDIPNTVKGATRALAKYPGVQWFDVHASAGRGVIEHAAANKGHMKLLVVTVLTSLAGEDCLSIFRSSPLEVVSRFADMATSAGADGIVCSPQEVGLIKTQYPHLTTVVPGTRPLWSSSDDQARVATPFEAVRDGADFLVIGRPILGYPEERGGPVVAVQLLATDIAAALAVT